MWLKEGLWRDWPIYSHWPQNLISVLNAAARCCAAAAVLCCGAVCCSARCAGPTPQRGHDGRRLNQQNLYLLLITFAKCHPDTRSAILRVWVIAAGAITATKHHLPLNIQRGLFYPGWWGRQWPRWSWSPPNVPLSLRERFQRSWFSPWRGCHLLPPLLIDLGKLKSGEKEAAAASASMA